MARTQSVKESFQDDSIPVVKTVHELMNSDSKKLMLRTNNICFQFVTLHLDTFDYQNRALLDSIADYLLSHNDVKSVEVDIHLSLREWYEEYSVSKLLYMYEEIIAYLVNKGVDTSYITGRQCYDYYPIVDCNKLSGEEARNCFDNDDFRLNRRVEFIITKREIVDTSCSRCHQTKNNPMWIEINQGGWGDKIIFSRYGVIVSAFNYHGDFRRQFYNTTYYPPSKLDKCSIDSLFEYVNTHYQHSKCKEFTTNKTLTLDGTWTEIYMQNGRYVNTMGTTVDCFSKEMDIIERMANRILDELSDSNNIYTGGYVEDCDIAETSPYCYLNTLEGSTFRDFFCQFYVDDELLFTICEFVGLLYDDGQACFIPENPDHVKKQYSYNWGKLLYRMRNDLLQCQSDTIPGMNGNYLLVRFNGHWSYINGLDMKTLKQWLKMMDKVVPRAYRKSFKRKKEQLILSWNKK